MSLLICRFASVLVRVRGSLQRSMKVAAVAATLLLLLPMFAAASFVRDLGDVWEQMYAWNGFRDRERPRERFSS